MLLNSVIIILREVLEAALLFSILMALSKHSKQGQKWFPAALLIGAFGAVIYGLNIDSVTQWFDGVGQEVINALMQFAIYIFLIMYLFLLFYSDWDKSEQHIMLSALLILVGVLSVTREGSEIFLYFQSLTRIEKHLIAALIGMAIGASIGVSIGFLIYYFVSNLQKKWSTIISLLLLILVAAGIVSQATLLLIQADWLPSQMPLWDSSQWLSEKSVMGQLLYSLIGYESTPTLSQLVLYLCGLIIPVILLKGKLFQSPFFKNSFKNDIKNSFKNNA